MSIVNLNILLCRKIFWKKIFRRHYLGIKLLQRLAEMESLRTQISRAVCLLKSQVWRCQSTSRHPDPTDALGKFLTCSHLAPDCELSLSPAHWGHSQQQKSESISSQLFCLHLSQLRGLRRGEGKFKMGEKAEQIQRKGKVNMQGKGWSNQERNFTINTEIHKPGGKKTS